MPTEMFTDERMMLLPDPVFRTALGLRANADNWGRESANPALIKGVIWPLRQDVTVDDVFDHLVRLRDDGVIFLYEDRDRWVYQMADWPAVSHRSDARARFPPPPSGDIPETFPAGEEEGEGEDADESEDAPPSRYCPKHRPNGTFKKCGPCGTARERNERWRDRQLDLANAEFRERGGSDE